jgi:hypothetical protein
VRSGAAGHVGGQGVVRHEVEGHASAGRTASWCAGPRATMRSTPRGGWPRLRASCDSILGLSRSPLGSYGTGVESTMLFLESRLGYQPAGEPQHCYYCIEPCKGMFTLDQYAGRDATAFVPFAPPPAGQPAHGQDRPPTRRARAESETNEPPGRPAVNHPSSRRTGPRDPSISDRRNGWPAITGGSIRRAAIHARPAADEGTKITRLRRLRLMACPSRHEIPQPPRESATGVAATHI